LINKNKIINFKLMQNVTQQDSNASKEVDALRIPSTLLKPINAANTTLLRPVSIITPQPIKATNTSTKLANKKNATLKTETELLNPKRIYSKDPEEAPPQAAALAINTAPNPYAIDAGVVHLRIQKRTGKKCLTFIQGIPDTVDTKSLCQKIRKMYHCNCTEIDHPKIGKCVQMSGDSRDDLIKFLIKEGVVSSDKEIKIHGF
jgi:translation initiation factor 1